MNVRPIDVKKLEIISLGSREKLVLFLPMLSTSIDKPMTFIIDDTARKRRRVCAHTHICIHPFIYLPCAFCTVLLKTLLIPTSSRFIATAVSFAFQCREREREKKKTACAEDIVNKVRGPANKKIAFLKEVERTGEAPRTSVRRV